MVRKRGWQGHFSQPAALQHSGHDSAKVYRVAIAKRLGGRKLCQAEDLADVALFLVEEEQAGGNIAHRREHAARFVALKVFDPDRNGADGIAEDGVLEAVR